MALANLFTVHTGLVFGLPGKTVVWRGELATARNHRQVLGDESAHYALEAWERMTQGGAIIEPAQRDNLHKISFVRKLMEDARTAIERNEAEVMSRAFYR